MGNYAQVIGMLFEMWSERKQKKHFMRWFKDTLTTEWVDPDESGKKVAVCKHLVPYECLACGAQLQREYMFVRVLTEEEVNWIISEGPLEMEKRAVVINTRCTRCGAWKRHKGNRRSYGYDL